jgi:DNA-binding beta-propeller fold protein YncE
MTASIPGPRAPSFRSFGRTRALAIASVALPLATYAAVPNRTVSSESGVGLAQELAGTIVVVNKSASTARIIDVGSGRTLATLPTGNGPHEVVMSSDGDRAVVTDYGGRPGGNTLTVIDVEGLAVEETIDLGEHSRPHGITFLPGDTLIAVTSEDSRHVVIVRVADGEIVKAIPTGHPGSHMLAMIASGERIYTSNIGDGTVSELNVGAGSHAGTIAVPPQPEAIGVTPDGSEVWVGSNAEGTVNAIDTASGEVEVALSEFGWPYRILFTPDQSRVLIPDLRGNELRIVDRAERRALHVVPFPGGGPQGITLMTGATHAFQSLSQRGVVVVVDLETGAVVGEIEAGPTPDGVAYSRKVVTPSAR